MARGLNKVMIIGNLGRDPETRQTQNGGMVTNLAVATSETWKDKNTGEAKEKTEWHRVVAFGKLAEIMDRYLRKGSKVYVEGSLQTRKWQDNNGTDRYTTEIIARDMQMLDSKSDAPAPQQSTPAPQQSASAPETKPVAAGNFDDDIPF